jgi:hypothetical protein
VAKNKKMKNSENIDKIFSDGLHAYERQPRPQAWEKLEARLQKPKSKVLPIWWKYASAASVALLLGIGGYWFGSQKEVMPEFGAIKSKTPPSLINPSNTTVELSSKMPENSGHSQNVNNMRTTKHICPVGTITVEYPENRILDEKIEYPIEKQESKQIAQTTIPEIKKLAPEPNTIILVLENQQSKVEEETIVLNMVEIKPEVVAQTDLNDGISKKETRLSKIWQQLKRAKNGENVNWSEVGIKPQKMLARADAKIENVLTKGENNEQ